MTGRSWRWLRTRILGLVYRPPIGYAPSGRPVFATRIQECWRGPAADAEVARLIAERSRRR